MDLEEAIKKNKKIRMKIYAVSDVVEQRLQRALEIILDTYDHPRLVTPIFTSAKELIMNAVKANYKNIYFEDYSPAAADGNALDYEIALKLFKHELSSGHAKYLEHLARKFKISVSVLIWVSRGTLHIKVTNPAAMTRLELRKVKQKLADAQDCDNIMEYFMKIDNDPEREGAGLGLVIISMILKSLDLPQKNLSIRSMRRKTTASLEIPLDRRFHPFD